jgi:hypothetical protein
MKDEIILCQFKKCQQPHADPNKINREVLSKIEKPALIELVMELIEYINDRKHGCVSLTLRKTSMNWRLGRLKRWD